MNTPLAERMRPHDLDTYLGQQHLVGKQAVLRKAIETGHIPSIILWGPPGTGKTTLARIIAQRTDRPFHSLTAINAGVKDIREILDKARSQRFFSRPNPILFIDEIHRFSKSQQDTLLGAVEDGTITLIGATTENPSFEIISALLSRCQVYIINPLSKDELLQLLHHALEHDEYLQTLNIQLQQTEAILRFSGGDARKLYNTLEIVVNAHETPAQPLVITNELVTQRLQQNITLYDKSGEQHYDIISAFIKSIRGSSPDAAVYWLARMLAGGEDIQFIARRLIILASEDIGLANPNALLLANNCFQAIHTVGMPEARIILSQTTLYLATSPKSNSAYLAIEKALHTVREHGDLPVPLHLRNAPTALLKSLSYGKDYQYAHDHPDHFIHQQFLPDQLTQLTLYQPADNPAEQQIKTRMDKLWANNG